MPQTRVSQDVARPSTSRAPLAVARSSTSTLPLSVTYYRVTRTNVSSTPQAVTDSMASRAPAVTDSSAPSPSYGSVILIPPTAPTASDDTDDGLPTYEHVLIDIVERFEN